MTSIRKSVSDLWFILLKTSKKSNYYLIFVTGIISILLDIFFIKSIFNFWEKLNDPSFSNISSLTSLFIIFSIVSIFRIFILYIGSYSAGVIGNELCSKLYLGISNSNFFFSQSKTLDEYNLLLFTCSLDYTQAIESIFRLIICLISVLVFLLPYVYIIKLDFLLALIPIIIYILYANFSTKFSRIIGKRLNLKQKYLYQFIRQLKAFQYELRLSENLKSKLAFNFKNIGMDYRKMIALNGTITASSRPILEYILITTMLVFLFIKASELETVQTSEKVILTSYSLLILQRLLPLLQQFFITTATVGRINDSLQRIKESFNLIKQTENNKNSKEIINRIEPLSLEVNDFTIKIIDKNISRKISKEINWSAKLNKLNIIKGESGAGKTTFLSYLSGIEIDNSNSINYKINKLKLTKPENLKNYICYSPQFPSIYPGTLYQNLFLYSFDKYNYEQYSNDKVLLNLIEKYLLIFKLDKLLDNIYSQNNLIYQQLSGGQIKRISIIRSFLSGRKILVFDEPTSGLDKFNSKIVTNQLIKECEKKLIIITSHDNMIASSKLNILNIEKN